MKREPGLREDARNLSLITVSACAAGVFTVGMLFAAAAPRRARVVISAAEPPPTEYAFPAPKSLSDRLFGTVTTRDGSSYTGFIRWDKNEGSWADVLDATKGDRLSGIRFGNVATLDRLGRSSALLTLKSGEQVELGANATDLGEGLRALIVSDAAGHTVEMRWDDLDRVAFSSVPAGFNAPDGRMFGTLTTRGGLDFTGYVTWDIDEIYSSDILDGDLDGHRQKIPFGAIVSIARNNARSARVTLRGDAQIVLDGTNDVDDSNSGISISVPGLGQALVQWDDFEEVRFREPDAAMTYADFDETAPIRGTVVTEDGRSLSGDIRWDNDESSTWEMLNGNTQGVELQIEFGNIARIDRNRDGARVQLRDGRVFELSGSNDVDDGNGGIFVTRDGVTERVRWSEFSYLELAGA